MNPLRAMLVLQVSVDLIAVFNDFILAYFDLMWHMPFFYFHNYSISRTIFISRQS